MKTYSPRRTIMLWSTLPLARSFCTPDAFNLIAWPNEYHVIPGALTMLDGGASKPSKEQSA